MAGRIPALPLHWQDYLLCLVLSMALPLLPLGLERWQTGAFTDKSLTLVAAMYSISIGVASRSRLLFGLSIFVSIVFAVAFGVIAGQGSPLQRSGRMAGYTILVVFLVNALERYNRHIFDRTPFWNFD